MQLIWSAKATTDLDRIAQRLWIGGERTVKERIANIRAHALALLDAPRMGERIPSIAASEVRRIMFQDYELRYRVAMDAVTVLRVWHTREFR